MLFQSEHRHILVITIRLPTQHKCRANAWIYLGGLCGFAFVTTILQCFCRNIHGIVILLGTIYFEVS